jgi:hypothetical protein
MRRVFASRSVAAFTADVPLRYLLGPNVVIHGMTAIAGRPRRAPHMVGRIKRLPAIRSLGNKVGTPNLLMAFGACQRTCVVRRSGGGLLLGAPRPESGRRLRMNSTSFQPSWSASSCGMPHAGIPVSRMPWMIASVSQVFWSRCPRICFLACARRNGEISHRARHQLLDAGGLIGSAKAPRIRRAP